MSPSGQENFIRNHIAKYLHDTRKVRASTKPKFRPSVQEWDKVVNYTQVMEGVKAEVREFFQEDPEKATEVNARVHEAFMSRRGWWFCGEICTSDSVGTSLPRCGFFKFKICIESTVDEF